MTIAPKAPAGLLRMDTFSSIRPSVTADAEGNLTAGATVYASGRGTFSGITARDIDFAASRGTTIDASFSVDPSLDIQTADLLTIRGQQYEVVGAATLRLSRRCLLRAVV